MSCNEGEFQVRLSRKIVLLQIFIGHRSAWFGLLSACRLLEFNTSVISMCLGVYVIHNTLIIIILYYLYSAKYICI